MSNAEYVEKGDIDTDINHRSNVEKVKSYQDANCEHSSPVTQISMLRTRTKSNGQSNTTDSTNEGMKITDIHLTKVGPPAVDYGAPQKGITQSIQSGLSKTDHLEAAKNLADNTFSRFDSAGIVAETTRAIEFQMKFESPEKYEVWLETQLGKWLQRAEELSAGKSRDYINIDVFHELLSDRELELGIPALSERDPEGVPLIIKHLKEGFPSVGKLGYPEIFKKSQVAEDQQPAISVDELLASQEQVLKETLKRLSLLSQDDKEFVFKSMTDEVDKGWAVEISQDEIDRASAIFFPRFTAVRKAWVNDWDFKVKLRAIDDGKANRVNEAVLVVTPIKLPTVGTYAEVLRRFKREALRKKYKGKVISAKADHKAAYRQLKASSRLQRLITIQDPESGKIRYFAAGRLLFGEVPSVLGYNAFSVSLCKALRKRFGIPIMSYFDDFIFPAMLTGDFPDARKPGEGRGIAPLDFFMILCNSGVRTAFEQSKTELGEKIAYLGINIEMDNVFNKIILDLSPGRRRDLQNQASEVINQGFLSKSQASEIAGRLGFACSVMFGRVGRAMLRPLLFRAHRDQGNQKISKAIKASLEWWISVLADEGAFRRKIDVIHPDRTKVILYTDASFKGLGGVMYSKDVGDHWSEPVVFEAPIDIGKNLESDAAIEVLEVLAVLAAMQIWQNLLEDSEVLIFVDNNNALANISRGAARRAAANPPIRHVWELAAAGSMFMWLERVDSKANLSDEPSRRCPLDKSLGRYSYAKKSVVIDSIALSKAVKDGVTGDILKVVSSDGHSSF